MFKYILNISAFALAACAAFFSVKGIGLLYSGSFYSIIIMASSLELGKLIAASYLYRYWNQTLKIFKYYMVFATLLLMCITSLGIFGFLSDAFQKNYSQYNLNITKINSLKSQQNFNISQIDFNKNKLKDLINLQKTYQNSLDSAAKQDVTINKTINEGLFSSGKIEKVVDSKLIESKNKIVEASQQNINSLFNQISIANQNLENLEKQSLELSEEIIKLENDNTKGEVGTFKFVSEAFGLKLETAVKIFTILLVIVFDPLAVSLIIAYNNISMKQSPILSEKPIEKIVEKIINVTKYQTYKRGTKKNHNPDLADPYLRSNQTKE